MSKSELPALGPDQKARLQAFIENGLRIKQEVKDLSDSLKDLSKTVAEELGLKKPGPLMKALNTAFKNSAADDREVADTVEDILNVTGYV